MTLVGIDHLHVVRSVTWPLNGNEAGGELLCCVSK